MCALSTCRFILRNHIAQRAIDFAENGDFSEVCVYICVAFVCVHVCAFLNSFNYTFSAFLDEF